MHVDCTGSTLKSEHLTLLAKSIRMIGLPLDGSSIETHTAMRGDKGKSHFVLVLDLLDALSDTPILIKVNTVVSKVNIDDIPNMVSILSKHRVDFWSIYQYWPFAGNGSINSRHIIDDGRFDEVVRKLSKTPVHFNIEINPISERLNTYFFVFHSGDVYMTTQDVPTDYIFLGSIFDDKTISLWFESNAASLRSSSLVRYQELLSSEVIK